MIKIKTLFLAVSLLSLTPANSIAVEEMLDLTGTGIKTAVKLPFPYLPEADERRLAEDRLLVIQGSYHPFDSQDPNYNRILLTGTVSPCIALVAVYNDQAGNVRRGLVAHVDYQTRYDSLLDPIRNLKDPGETQLNPMRLTVTLYTESVIDFATRPINSLDDHETIDQRDRLTWASIYGKPSQTEIVRELKDFLCTGLQLDRARVPAKIFTLGRTNISLGHYIGATSQLAITRDGSIYCVSHYRTNPFNVTQAEAPGMDVRDPGHYTRAEFQKLRGHVNLCSKFRIKHSGVAGPMISFIVAELPICKLTDYHTYALRLEGERAGVQASSAVQPSASTSSSQRPIAKIRKKKGNPQGRH